MNANSQLASVRPPFSILHEHRSSSITESLSSAGAFFFSWSLSRQALIAWSSNSEQVLGLTSFELERTKRFLRYVHSHDRLILLEELKRQWGRDDEYRTTFRWTRPQDGAIRWLHLRGTRLMRHGELLLEGIVLDLTADFSGADAAIPGGKAASRLIASLPTLVFQADRGLKVTRINAYAAAQEQHLKVGGFDFAALRPGKSVLLCASDPVQRRSIERAAMRICGAKESAVRMRLVSANAVFNLIIRPLGDGMSISGLTFTLQDVTEAVRLEKQMSEVVRIEELRSFSTSVAQNFNNCLQILAAYAGVVSNPAASNETIGRAGKLMLQTIDRAAMITRQLFPPGPTREVTDANSVMLYALSAQEASSLKLHLTLNLCRAAPVVAESQVLLDAISDALAEAIKLGAKSGRLLIESTVIELGENELAGLRSGHYVKIVFDPGKIRTVPRLSMSFERLLSFNHQASAAETQSEEGEPSGLELYRVYSIARALGGAVLLGSDEPDSLALRILLPLAVTSAEASPTISDTRISGTALRGSGINRVEMDSVL